MSVSLIVLDPNAPQESQSNRLFLILIDEAKLPSDSALLPLGPDEIKQTVDAKEETDTQSRIAQFREELRVKEEYLQNIHSELDNANEELKSSNEEMQAVNEELQSTNEELETSKEEMQSINEELSTVNAELQTKVVDLSRLNNDMNNLLAGSGVATVFVDQNLRILRFTPTIVQLINLIPSDVGRPVGHIVSNFVGYESLVPEAQSVLDSLVPKEKQVQTKVGTWFAMRIRPYRTLENVIEGVVFTFTDITEVKRVEASLEKANRLARLAVVVRDSYDAITVQDLDGRIMAWNPGATRIYGWSEAEALQMNSADRIPEHLRNAYLAKLRELSRAAIPEPYRSQRLTKKGTILEVWITVTALIDESQQTYAIATTERAGSTLTKVTP